MQQTNFRFEAVVHDDVSTDGSVAIIKEYAEKFPDIIKPVYETENQYSKGTWLLFDALYSNSCGKYIALCQSDDYWIDAHKLQRQFDYMESHPDVSMCGTNGLVLYEDHDSAPVYFSPWLKEEILDPAILFSHLVFHTCSFFYRREIYELSRAFKSTVYSDDQCLKLLAVYAGQVATLGTVSTVFRVDNGRAKSFTQTHRFNDYGKWVVEQSMHFYVEYDKFTNGRFHDIVEEKQRVHRIRLDTARWRHRIGLLALVFVHPGYNWPHAFRGLLNRLPFVSRKDYYYRK